MTVLGDLPAWHTQAACAGLTTAERDNWFFPQQGDSVKPAKAICAICPVRAECLEYAQTHGEFWGIWGGLTARERQAIRRRRLKAAS